MGGGGRLGRFGGGGFSELSFFGMGVAYALISMCAWKSISSTLPS